MKTWSSNRPIAVLVLSLVALALPVGAQGFQLISALPPGQESPAGGNGDSWAPVLSPDGRYVLFASTANNLLLATNNQPIPAPFSPIHNVYLRDRTNGTTSLVSVNLTGAAGGNGDSVPLDISTNGRYALFESRATDLVAGDTNSAPDVFVRDLVDGTTILVSSSTNGLVGNGASRSAVMTPDGRYVAFVSAANNLAASDTNGIADVFVRDLSVGQTVLVSVGATSTNLTQALGSSEAPDITPDGRFVAFYSTATNLVAGVSTVGELYVRDLLASNTLWVSSYARTALNSNAVVSFNHALSADGRFVAFEASLPFASAGTVLRYSLGTGQTDLVHTNAAVQVAAYEDIHNLELTPDGRYIVFVANTNGTSGATTCILRWEAETGLITLVSGNLSNQVPTGSTCDWPTIDPSGRWVAFLSSAPNLVTNTLVGQYHLYLHDLGSATTTLLDADKNGVGSAALNSMSLPRLSANGRFVAFECADSTLVANDRNRDADIFVRELASGTTELISARAPALVSLSANGPSLLGGAATLSRDGGLLVFASEADNLTANDTNGCRDVFVRDLVSGIQVLVSVATNGSSADSISSEPAISPDGRFVAFSSIADNLVAGDTNKAQDVFVRDLQSGITTLVSVNSSGTGPGNKDSYAPVIGAGGRYVLFRSKATDLAATPFGSNAEHFFLRDLQSGTTYCLQNGMAPSVSGSTATLPAAMTPDGRFVAFGAPDPFNYSSLYLWDAQASRRSYTNTLFSTNRPLTSLSLQSVAMTPDGQKLAYAFTCENTCYLFAANVVPQTATQIETSSGPFPSLHLSTDGRYLVCNRTASAASNKQIYLYDLQTATKVLVSHRYDSLAEANGNCDAPDLSPDGRFVIYRGTATDLVAGDTNGVPDIFLYDRQSGQNTLLSANRLGGIANNRSLNPCFSPDGQTLVFQSWASDLMAGDFNHNGDVFAYTLLTLSVLPATTPGEGPWLCWPHVPGKSYRVQFKTSLTSSDWQDVSGSISTQGTKAFLRDLAPAPSQKFYRVQAF